MNQLASIAQSQHRNIDQQVTQIEELQATITTKDEVIAQQDECGRTNLNYTSSSTQVCSCRLQRASNGIILWPVG
jgi:uncharacterized protein (DUF3084 family)